ncbi:MAG: hypothetical protein QMD65_00935 [Patescibacteria group bacterium]|nr:hypothetical protein [Patescibacteria group bacterium]
MVFFLISNSNNKNNPDLVMAKKATINQEVSITGKIKSIKKVDLGFERSGTLSEVKAKIGDKINANSIILKLDISELMAKLKSAEAALEVERAKFDGLKLGTRPALENFTNRKILLAGKLW